MGILNKAKKVIDVVFSSDEKQKEVEDLKKGRTQFGFRTHGYGGSSYSSVGTMGNLNNSQNLLLRYSEYEDMDEYPELTGALDIYADDTTVVDMFHNKSIWGVADDRVVRIILDDLFNKRIEVDDIIWALARQLAKYGNVFGEIIAGENGVVGLQLLPPPTMRRIETKKGTLVGFVQTTNPGLTIKASDVKKVLNMDKKNRVLYDNSAIVFSPSEIVHWRLNGKDPSSPYGFSVIDGARWVFKRLAMAEDTSIVHQLQKSNSRFAHYVEVGDLTPEEGLSYVDHIKNMHRNKLNLDGAGRMSFNPKEISPTDDYWIPVRDGQESTRVDVLSGPDYQNVPLLEYLRTKLSSSSRVPRAYMGMENTPNRASLAQEDARFARTVMRLQREIKNGFRQIIRVHLILLGINPDSVHFDVKMAVPSSIFEMAQIELRNAQADNASSMSEYFDKQWIMENVFDFSKDDALYAIDKKQGEKEEELKKEIETKASLAKDYPQLADEVGESINMMKMRKLYENISRHQEKFLKEISNKINHLGKQQDNLKENFLKKVDKKIEHIEKQQESLNEVYRRQRLSKDNQR